MLSGGRLEPRKVIGSVDTSEFAVSAAASLGFLIGIGVSGIYWAYAIALLVGGLVAAPLAALLVRVAPAHLLGVAVGGLIVVTTVASLYVAALRARRQAAAAGTEVALESVNA